MKQYLRMMRQIKNEGVDRPDRTGVGTRSIFGGMMRFNLQDGFPLLTTKRIHTKSIIHELLWFLSGDTNIKYLTDNGVSIWNEWANEEGELGPLYGEQWRSWPTNDGGAIDQIQRVIEGIKNSPYSRRNIVSAWNVEYLPDETVSPQENVNNGRMALAACHTMFQFYVADNKLSCLLLARSQDFFLGTPFNISCYSLLVHMIAQQCNLEVGDFVWMGGDVHLYRNHFEQADIQMSRMPRELPKLNIKRKPESIFDYAYDDFEFIGYNPHPSIKAPIAI